MYKLFLILLISSPLFLAAQQAEEDVIQWSPDQKLSWADYKGKPDASSGAAASTATYLGIDYDFSSDGLTYRIHCSFSKNKSWGLHQNDHILSHEQGHFDIAEIYARKLNQKMTTYVFNRNTYKTDLRKIYEDILKEKEEMQDTYDRETDHSIQKDKQEEWLKKIAAMLADLNKYRNYH